MPFRPQLRYGAVDPLEQPCPVIILSRAEQLLDLAPVGIHHTDAAGTCTWVNERWSAITGISPADACGRPWLDAVHDGDRGPLLAQWLETVARGLEFVCDVRVGGRARAGEAGHDPLGARPQLPPA